MDSEVAFNMFKNMIIAQNKELLKRLAKDLKRNEQAMIDRYVKPEFYLPIIQTNGHKSRP